MVVEHLIQASDVAHTMQHWQVYAKWNERLFVEMYTAYCQVGVKVNWDSSTTTLSRLQKSYSNVVSLASRVMNI